MPQTFNFTVQGGTGGDGGASPNQAGPGGRGEGNQFIFNFPNGQHTQQDMNPAAPGEEGSSQAENVREQRRGFQDIQDHVHLHPQPQNTTLGHHDFQQAYAETLVAYEAHEPMTIYDNYHHQMQCQGRGYPLYIPAPQEDLAPQYRRQGIAIGDLGMITPEGIFDFFFNIFLAEDHPINNNRVPRNFVPCASECLQYSGDIQKISYDPGDCVITASVSDHNRSGDLFPGSEYSFHCQGARGAVLALPHGAFTEQLKNLGTVKLYAEQQAQTWHDYIFIERGRTAESNTLVLVTGWEKTSAWGIVSYKDQNPASIFTLRFQPTGAADSGWNYRWSGSRIPYPNPRHADLSRDDQGAVITNQTTFIHGFAISFGAHMWQRSKSAKLSQLTNLQKKFSSTKTSGGFFKKSLKSLFSFGNSSPRSQSASQVHLQDSISITAVAPVSPRFNLSQYFNESLLNKLRDCDIVMSHSDLWAEALYAQKTKPSDSRSVQKLINKSMQGSESQRASWESIIHQVSEPTIQLQQFAPLQESASISNLNSEALTFGNISNFPATESSLPGRDIAAVDATEILVQDSKHLGSYYDSQSMEDYNLYPPSEIPPQAKYQYLPMVGAPSLYTPHRILQYMGPTTNLIYNVTLPVANVIIGMQASVLSELSEPATTPPLPLITLVHPRLGGNWKIVCKPKDSDETSNSVRVADVLEAIYVSLRQDVTGAEYDELPSAVARAEVTKTFTRRYSRMPNASMQLAEMNRGLKRVDWLGTLTKFAGITPSATVPGVFDLLLVYQD